MVTVNTCLLVQKGTKINPKWSTEYQNNVFLIHYFKCHVNCFFLAGDSHMERN